MYSNLTFIFIRLSVKYNWLKISFELFSWQIFQFALDDIRMLYNNYLSLYRIMLRTASL